MNTQLSEDQASLQAYCQKLLEKEWPLEKAMKALAPGGTGHSPELWKTLAEAGWLGLPFSNEVGGADGDLVDLGIVYRAAGERLVPGTLYSCIFALLLIDRIGTPAQKKALMPSIIAGHELATTAYSEPQAAEEARFFTAAAKRKADGWELEGTKAFVANLDTADTVLVLANARSNGDRKGWGLFIVDKAQVAAGVRPTSAFGGEALSELDLKGVRLPASALLGGDDALFTTLDAFYDVVEQATALQCMEMTGGVTEVLTRTVKYVSERRQHGRPLGSNQAVQHLLARVSIQLDGARMAALQAVFLKSQGRAAAREVSIAKMALGETYTNATITAHQVWGSMGYARESGLYLWSERAKVADAWLGTRASHTRKLAEQMGL